MDGQREVTKRKPPRVRAGRASGAPGSLRCSRSAGRCATRTSLCSDMLAFPCASLRSSALPRGPMFLRPGFLPGLQGELLDRFARQESRVKRKQRSKLRYGRGGRALRRSELARLIWRQSQRSKLRSCMLLFTVSLLFRSRQSSCLPWCRERLFCLPSCLIAGCFCDELAPLHRGGRSALGTGPTDPVGRLAPRLLRLIAKRIQGIPFGISRITRAPGRWLQGRGADEELTQLEGLRP